MTDAVKSQRQPPLEASVPMASLESILCTEELSRRPRRPPGYEKENRALVALAGALVHSKSDILQTLAETIREVTECDSSGLSLLTNDGKRFYWPAIAGTWQTHVGGGTPRDFGPCGDVLDRNRALLFKHFEKRYPYLLPVVPAAEGCLLVPFYVRGKAVGTIWAIMHTDRRKFDAEDERIMSSLGQFTSVAYQTVESIEDLKVQIAARENVEAALRELASGLEAKVRRLVEANLLGIFIWDLEGKIDEANEAFLNIVQYTREDLVSGGVRWTDLTPAKWRARDELALAALKMTAAVQPYEKEFFRKDGSRVPVLVGGALFEKGGSEGVAFVLDLSEQKRVEEALRRNEAYLSEAQKLSRTGSWRWNIGTGEVIWSQEFFAIFGFDSEKDKASHQLYLERIHPHDRSKVEEARSAAIGKRQHFEAEYRLLLPGGLIKYLHSVGHCLVDQSGGVEYIGAVMDITERKRAEEERERLRQAQRIVVDTANDAVVSADEKGVIQFANPATMRVFGYDPKELIGKPLTTLMPEFMRKLHEDGFRRYLATGQRHINWQGTELTGLRKNGQEFPVEISFGELTMKGNRVFTGFIRDITERRQAAEERERLHRVQADLAHVTRVSTMGELTASLAHEIKQPIGAAVTNAEACIRLINRPEPDLSEAREAALEMVKDAKRAADIIDRVRLLYQKGSSQLETFDLNDVIGEMVNMMGDEANRHAVTIRTERAQELPHVLADRVQLQQALMNLMRNGIEAMQGTGGELRITSQLAPDGQLLISVSDTGVGLAIENLDKIFKAFFTTKTQGTGLGLAITRSVIESHGGHIWATANSGGGATFRFTLPIRAAAGR